MYEAACKSKSDRISNPDVVILNVLDDILTPSRVHYCKCSFVFSTVDASDGKFARFISTKPY